MREHGRAVALDMLVEAQPKASFGQHASQRGLADFQRITPQVVAIELDQVEGVEEYAPVGVLVTDELERGHAVVIASPRFAIDDARARAQASQCLDDQRKAMREVVARPRIKPHALTILAGNDAKPSCLISCSHCPPDGSLSVFVGRHGVMNPTGKVRCNMWTK